MLVISRIAASATSTSFHDTRPVQANPAKIAASDNRSTSVSSRRPASEARPYWRAMPPSIPSSTWPRAIRPSPPANPDRPVATATPAATLAPNAAHVTCAGDSPSGPWQSRSSGRIARSRVRPTAGAKSNTVLEPVDADVGCEQHDEHDPLFHLVSNARQPAARDPRSVRVERHLFEADAVIHGYVNREEQDRQRRSEKHAQRHDPEQRHRLLQRGSPVVAALVAQTDRPQIQRCLHRVVDVDAHAERVGEHLVPPLETHRLDAERRGEEVRDDRHGAAARCGARRPENHTRASPPPIQTRSRSRLTMAVYTPRAGSSPSSWNTRYSEPSLVPTSNGTTKMAFCTSDVRPPMT